MASSIARTGSSGCGRHHVIHAVVKVLDAELRLLEREVAILRVFRDFGIGQPPQSAVLLAHDRPETLEAGAAERGIVHEQEIAAPKSLARDRPVGLRVDGEEDTRRAVRLRHALHQHQNVPVRIGIHGPRAQRRLRQRHGVKIGVVVVRRHAHRSGMDDVADVPQIVGEGRRCPQWLRFGAGGFAAGAVGCGCGSGCDRENNCNRLGVAPARARRRCGVLLRRGVLLGRRRWTGDLGMLDVEPLIALRRLAAGAARAIRIAERQPHLVCEIGAQKVDEVGAVGAKAFQSRCLRRDPDS